MLNDNRRNLWSFYCFTEITQPAMIIPKLLLIAKKKLIKGTILLANEGFNGSIAGDKQALQLLLDKLIELTNAQGINIKYNTCALSAFSKFKIKVKREIVTFGIDALDVNNLKGEYIKPSKWDEFTQSSDVVVIDTRNKYEVEQGTFANAINPQIDNFRDLPQWLEQNLQHFKAKKVAMFCTGGIRCEKSTAYLKKIGHDKVYHLEGGILQYFEDTKNQNQLWSGGCFVFDDRRYVEEDLLDPRSKEQTSS